MKFSLGKTVMTREINDCIAENEEFAKEVIYCMKKYANCDWGECCSEDWETNDSAVKNDERILASYETSVGKIWIITEWDRSYTTILFPHEY